MIPVNEQAILEPAIENGEVDLSKVTYDMVRYLLKTRYEGNENE